MQISVECCWRLYIALLYNHFVTKQKLAYFWRTQEKVYIKATAVMICVRKTKFSGCLMIFKLFFTLYLNIMCSKGSSTFTTPFTNITKEKLMRWSYSLLSSFSIHLVPNPGWSKRASSRFSMAGFPGSSLLWILNRKWRNSSTIWTATITRKKHFLVKIQCECWKLRDLSWNA